MIAGVDANVTYEGRSLLEAAIAQPVGIDHDLVVGIVGYNHYDSLMPRAADVMRIALAHGCDPEARTTKGETVAETLEGKRMYWMGEPHFELRDELLQILRDASANN